VNPASGIRQATWEDVPAIAVILARAFHLGPFADWFIPNQSDRRLLSPSMFRLIAEHALTHGGPIDFISSSPNHDKIAGAAIWYKRITPPGTDPAFDTQIANALGAYADRWALITSTFEARHPAEPHWYLAYIGVSPNLQGLGLGGDLLRHGHTRADRDGLPAYLEATSAEVRPLYAAHGYATGDPLLVAERTALVWPMTRPAHTTAAVAHVTSPSPQTPPVASATGDRTHPSARLGEIRRS
jgi:ribosomal protein S18 acetylase RimI-like enzyme